MGDASEGQVTSTSVDNRRLQLSLRFYSFRSVYRFPRWQIWPNNSGSHPSSSEGSTRVARWCTHAGKPGVCSSSRICARSSSNQSTTMRVGLHVSVETGSAHETYLEGTDGDDADLRISRRVLKAGATQIGGMVLRGWATDSLLAGAVASLAAVAFERARLCGRKIGPRPSGIPND